MTKKEKILLLQIILEDIRGDWGLDLWNRVDKAKELAKELKLGRHIDRIEDFESHSIDYGNVDGRHFRCSYDFGGYQDMGILHGLDKTYKGKSDEFKIKALEILNYPKHCFNDWEEINNA